MNSKLSAFLISLFVSSCSSTAPSAPTPVKRLYDDATKLNFINLGMSSSEVTHIMGTPNTSLINPDGFRCTEYKLYKYSTDFKAGTSTYFIMLFEGKVIETGNFPCYEEMSPRHFQKPTNQSSGGKYGRFITNKS